LAPAREGRRHQPPAASAPEILVDDVIEALTGIGPVTVSVLPGREENIDSGFRPNSRRADPLLYRVQKENL